MRGRVIVGLLIICLMGCQQESDTSAEGPQALRLGALLGGDDAGFAKATDVQPIRFPVDHGAHEAFRSEWWYLTLNLQSESGDRYGVQFTIFRQGLKPGKNARDWDVHHVYMAHFAVSDVSAARHWESERFSRAHPDLAGVEPGPAVHIEGWRFEFGEQALKLRAETDAYAVRLDLLPRRPVTLQGDRGLSEKSPGNASYYYSYPRLEVSGTLRADGEDLRVSGLGWFDHEWSTSVLSDGQVGWDWFALHLGDGRDIMAFRLRRRDGARDPFDHGVVVASDGTPTKLNVDDFELTPQGYWQDDNQVSWPTAWALRIGDERWRIKAAFDDQRMQTSVPYWEGVVDVSEQTSGEGYMELTGYE